MTKQERLEKWIEVNSGKYPSKEAWKQALVRFVTVDLNYIEEKWGITCWCGKTEPCDREEHDMRLNLRITRLEKSVGLLKYLISFALIVWLFTLTVLSLVL